MKILDLISRILLGMIFLVFGLDKFLYLIPKPPVAPEAAGFLVALTRTGYFFPFLGGLEVMAGLFVLSGRFLPLGIAILAAIIPHIVLYLTLLAKAGPGFVMGFTLLSLEVYLFFRNKNSFTPLLKGKGGLNL